MPPLQSPETQHCRHVPEQSFGVEPLQTQLPPWQTCPPLQSALLQHCWQVLEQHLLLPQLPEQLPQCAGSLLSLTQELPQSVRPPEHEDVHVPLLHTTEPPDGGLQAVPQVPQCLSSVCPLTSQPLALLPSQSR
jgi:hypothetical protein